MLCANILYHNTSFDPITSPARKITLTVGMPSNMEEEGLLFKCITYTNQKGIFFENLTT